MWTAGGRSRALWLTAEKNEMGNNSPILKDPSSHCTPSVLAVSLGCIWRFGLPCPCRLPSPAKATGHCPPSSWSVTCALWHGTLGRWASSTSSQRCCSPVGALPAGTAGTTTPHPQQSPSTSCWPATAETTQMSDCAIREAPCHPKLNQHLDYCPGLMAE